MAHPRFVLQRERERERYLEGGERERDIWRGEREKREKKKKLEFLDF